MRNTAAVPAAECAADCAAELNESGFSSDGLTVSFTRTADGKAKATIAPDGVPPSFFLSVRVK